jgi:hypothetical protein
LTRPFSKLDQNGSASEGPTPRPTISRRPSLLTATAIIAATETLLDDRDQRLFAGPARRTRQTSTLTNGHLKAQPDLHHLEERDPEPMPFSGSAMLFV